ncbi:MAG: 23S rRNA (adenine(2503)-C(2))-methyltransferase RlmN [Atopobiaceae bacterium]|nr:23S rRNA (adenine(2503)-C(2))-methyltransferase RlmN [Atopobiaceae bacterium]
MPTETPSPISGRTNIRSLSQDQLAGELASLGAPSYRVKQVVDWVWKKGVTSFDQMTNLPASLRKELEERFVLGTTHEVTRQVSVDGSRKYLLELEDGVCVECVGMPSPSGRLAVCASTQAGCGMGCAFCATGAAGLARSLTADEIYDQVMHVSDDFASRVTSVVLMGQGEPFANYDATMAALRRLNSPDDGLGIGARHLTVSTCGVIPGITRFANEPEQFTLAISLHSAVQTTRNAIMPGVRRWSLVHLHDVLATYVDKTGRRPTYEYALMGGVNDTDTELQALCGFCVGTLCHVNLIMLNEVEGSPFHPSTQRRAEEFIRQLSLVGVEATLRNSRGSDIDAACGQLSQRARKMQARR